MDRRTNALGVVRAIAVGLVLAIVGGAWAWDEPAKTRGDAIGGGAGATEALPTVNEARGRARLLHETIHDTLQVVHAQYYREDEGHTLPAAALKPVFRELAERRKVEIRWLVVDARAMNVDHNPRDEFEKQAVKALGEGKDEVDIAGDGVYRYAGPITLGSECLKCHLPNRTSNQSRKAGLVISMPVQKP
jgi:hypothetical protein